MDWNDDGLTDLVVGERDGYVNVFLRLPDSTLTDAGRIQVAGTDIDVGTNSAPFVFDWDSDGRKDLLVGRESTSGGSLYLYMNEGTSDTPVFNSFTAVERNGTPVAWSRTVPHMEDMNGDGKIDLMIGEDNGHTYYLENIAPSSSDPPEFQTYENITVNGVSYVWPSGQTDVTLTVNDWNEDGILDLVIGNYTKNLFVFLGNPTGIEGDEFQTPGLDLRIIGNPCSSLLNFEIGSTSPSETSISLYSMDGRLVLTRMLDLAEGSMTHSASVSHLPEGVYTVLVRSDDEQASRRVTIFR